MFTNQAHPDTIDSLQGEIKRLEAEVLWLRSQVEQRLGTATPYQPSFNSGQTPRY